jgi:hypothetical protein
LHRPDTISLRAATGIGGLRPSLVVDCEVFNNLESLGGLLDARVLPRTRLKEGITSSGY